MLAAIATYVFVIYLYRTLNQGDSVDEVNVCGTDSGCRFICDGW